MKPEVVTRFAPSPTGLLHGGNYRTAVFAYLFARKMGGKFIVRIEDTDQERSKKEYEENILETLSWLSLKPDTLFRQSEHVARHQEQLEKLIASGHAYVSKETPKEGQRGEVIRFVNPKATITFIDAIRGPISFDTTELGDFVIARSLSEPVFHLAVVVDDAAEGVTHVIRGEDHISNTPRQILIQKALGIATPVYAHLPLVLGPDRSKLSKRQGAKALTEYRDEGFIPEALINYLALLGWHPEGGQEIFSLNELIEAFNLSRIQKGAGIFDETKLRWFNHEHLKRLSDKEFGERLRQFTGKESDARLIPLLRERSQTLKEAADAMAAGEYDFLSATGLPDKELLLKGAKTDAASVKMHLEKVLGFLHSLNETFTPEEIKEAIFPYAAEQGRASVLWPLRVVLSGKREITRPLHVGEPHGEKNGL